MKKLILSLLCFFVLVSSSHSWMSLPFVAGGGGGGGTDFTADVNCQGAWLFASGSTLTDSSGNDNTLSDSGTVTFDTNYPTGFTTGQVGVFNGTDQNLCIADGDLNADFPAKSPTVDFAVSMWIKVVNPVTYNSYFAKGYGFHARIDYATSILTFEIKDSETTAVATNTDVGDTMVSWTHIVFSFAGADPTGTGTLWVSQGSFGSLEDATPLTYTNVKDVSDSNAFCIGSSGGSTQHFEGYIYQPIIFDRTLDAGEAEELYDNGIKGVN